MTTLQRNFTIAIAVILSGCSESPVSQSEFASGNSNFMETVGANSGKIDSTKRTYTPGQLEKSLRVTAQMLVLRDPTPVEVANAQSGIAGYESVVKGYLASPDFQRSIRNYFTNAFQMSGTANGINYDEATNLAVYLTMNDRDFREVLTADYCVTNDLQTGNCSSFPSADDQRNQAAGALTTRGFLQKFDAPFNFRRVAKAFEFFGCREYPDVRDDGLTQAEISDTVKGFSSMNEVPACYSCHRSMNPRAVLFYPFDRRGVFNRNPNANPNAGEIIVTDTGRASTTADLVKPGTAPRHYSKTISNLREYGQRLSETQYFRDCLAQRMVNLMTGKKSTTKIPPALQDIRDRVEINRYNVKQVLLEISTHPGFVLGRGTL